MTEPDAARTDASTRREPSEGPRPHGPLAASLMHFVPGHVGGSGSRSSFWWFIALGALPLGTLLGLAWWGLGAVAPTLPAPATIVSSVLLAVACLWLLSALSVATILSGLRRLLRAARERRWALHLRTGPCGARGGS
ncbi:MAG: hypothetical protein EAS51_08190 [Microbacteriaceae bacterium]|nr:MAG: hypothetical protein EAS51_08190 [Microbacteriaceae bacterium]